MTYDQWKTDPDWGRSYQEEEEEPTEEEYAFLEWCDNMLQIQDEREGAAEPGEWVALGAFVVLLDHECRPDFWTTCVLPSNSDVAVEQWLRF